MPSGICIFKPNRTLSGKKMVTGMQVVTASKCKISSIGGSHFVLPVTDCQADPLETHISRGSEQATKAKTLKC